MHEQNPQNWWILFPPFLITCTLCCLLKVKPLSLSSTYFSFVPFVWIPLWNSSLKMVPSILREGLPKCCSLSMSFLLLIFLVLWGAVFLFFLQPSFDSVCFHYSQVIVVFFLCKRPNAFLTRQFYSSSRFSLPIFHYEHATFFNAKFHFHVRTVYSYHLYQSPEFIYISAYNFITSMYIR